jgi:fluoride ion exporter CrcB/FEX
VKEHPKFIKYVLLGIALDVVISLIAFVYIQEPALSKRSPNTFAEIYALGITVVTVHTILIPSLIFPNGNKNLIKVFWASPLSFIYILLFALIGGCCAFLLGYALSPFLILFEKELSGFAVGGFFINIIAPVVAAALTIYFADEINVSKKFRQSQKVLLKSGAICGLAAWQILLQDDQFPQLPVFVFATAISGLCLSYLYNFGQYKLSLEINNPQPAI